MIFNEHLRKADELYECRFDNLGNAIHVYIKDGMATIFGSLNDLVKRVYFGEEVERFELSELQLEYLYTLNTYNYFQLKMSFWD